MTDRAERLRSAYGELLKRNLASTKKDIAEKMGASAPNVSSAFGGDPKVLTDRFLSRFNAAFGNIFSLDWLLSGEGEMLPIPVQQISYGDKSPNLNGKGNTVSFGCEDFKVFIDELAAQRRLAERTFDLLERRDAQIDRLISLLENQK